MNDTLVLCYHAVSPTWPAEYSITPDAFAMQLGRLARRGYRGVTFTDAVQRPTDGRKVAVTFDDAFASVVAHARPILDDLGWPATVYAVTDFAARGRPLEWDGIDEWVGGEHAHELMSLDWTALRSLRDAGWEIGSHTVSHPRLTALDNERLAYELEASRAATETALGEPCRSVAYPYGDVDDRVVGAAASAGYVTGAALPARWNELGPLEWPRVGVYHPDDMRRFRMKTARLGRKARGLLSRWRS